jgi:hypothetical protein
MSGFPVEAAMSATVTVVTPDDLLRMPDGGSGYEWVNGRGVGRPADVPAHYVAGQLLTALSGRGEARLPLWVSTAYPFRCFHDDPDRIRRPSVAAVFDARLSARRDDDYFPCPLVPDLVAEVVAKEQTADDLAARTCEWLDAGVKVVWVVNPATRTVRVHGEAGYTFLRAADTLTAPDLLPGFAVPVADLFRLPGEPAPVA